MANRRNFISGVAGCVLAAPFAAAQTPSRIPRIGILANYNGPPWDGFRHGMSELGYVEGRTIATDWRFAEGNVDRYPALAVAFAQAKVDLIVTSGTPAALAAKQATGSIPIVMAISAYPERLGLAESLSHPGGNITGMTNQSADLIGKKLQTLHEVVPSAKRIAMLVSGPAKIKERTIAAARDIAAKLGITLEVIEVPAPAALGLTLDVYEAATAAALGDAFAALKRGGAQAVLFSDTGGGMFFTERKRLADLALANRLPSMVANAEVVEAGALMSVAPDSVDNYLRAATFIEKILKGVKPADIPVEQPTAFDTTINMKTAKALNVVIPPALRVAARYVGE